MKLLLTRESVSQGDDWDAPHEMRYEIEAANIKEVAMWIAQSDYLPKNSDPLTSWSAESGFPIAVISHLWKVPKFPRLDPDMFAKKLKHEDGHLKIHLNHHYQVDPEIVLQVLRGYRYA